MNARIVEGSIVLVEQKRDGRTYQREAIACGPAEDGEVLVKFTTRGTENAYAVSKVTWAGDPW